jgi:ABC-type sugar transport system ATPase subunit
VNATHDQIETMTMADGMVMYDAATGRRMAA